MADTEARLKNDIRQKQPPGGWNWWLRGSGPIARICAFFWFESHKLTRFVCLFVCLFACLLCFVLFCLFLFHLLCSMFAGFEQKSSWVHVLSQQREESSMKRAQQKCTASAHRRKKVQTSANERKSKIWYGEGVPTGMIAANSSNFCWIVHSIVEQVVTSRHIV